MFQTREITTSNDFFSAMDNGYNIYVSTSGKLVAYSTALSSDSVKESISVNPVFIRDTFNTFFETTLHDLLHTQYAEALHKFFQKYLETHTHFTLEASLALKKELRTLITAIKTEQITTLYKMLPYKSFDVDATEKFFREISKIPYHILLRITGIPHLHQDFQQYLPTGDKITVEECIKVIEYFAQSFQTSEFSETPPSSVQGKWLMQEYSNIHSKEKKSQKNEERAITTESGQSTQIKNPSLEAGYVNQEEIIHPKIEYEAPHEMVKDVTQETNVYSHKSSDMEEQGKETLITEEVSDEETQYPDEDHDNMHTQPEGVESLSSYRESNKEESVELLLADENSHTIEEGADSREILNEDHPNINSSSQGEQSIPSEEGGNNVEGLLLPEETDISQSDNSPGYKEEKLEDLTLEIKDDLNDEEHEILNYPNELDLPYTEHHLLVEEQDDSVSELYKQGVDIETRYDDILANEEGSHSSTVQESESNVIFSYEEFITDVNSLESFVVNHASDFPEINELFMNDMYTLLAFVAQYHRYNINRQQSRFELLQHATAICIRYEEEKEKIPFVRILVLLTFALQSIEELQHRAPINNDFLQLLYTLSENYSVVEQYQALNISEYERVLVYASLCAGITSTVDIEQFLLHVNTISAISIIKELRQNIYSAHFFNEIASIPFEEIQHLEEYYNAYYYQMILFQYGEEFRNYIPADDYNSHTLFRMISIVEHIHSYVFTDEQQMEHCGKGILSILIEAYSIYVNDTSRPFIDLFTEIAHSFGE